MNGVDEVSKMDIHVLPLTLLYSLLLIPFLTLSL